MPLHRRTALFPPVVLGLFLLFLDGKTEIADFFAQCASVLCLELFGAGNFILPAMALIVLLLLVMRPALDKKGAVR